MSLYPSLEDMKVDQMAQVNRLHILEHEKVVPGCKIMYIVFSYVRITKTSHLGNQYANVHMVPA